MVARLTALRAGEDRSLDATLDEIVYEIDLARAGAKAVRGDARQTLIDTAARARSRDCSMLRMRSATRQTMQALAAEADAELAPFRGRMAPETYEQSRRAAVDRLLAGAPQASARRVRMIQTGSILTLDIEKPAAGGRMLARHHGQVVLVWGAIPGERVTARVDRTTKSVAFASTVDVLSPSPDRRAVAG